MRRKYTINENVFETINEESAYWIGFLMADGCVTTRKSSPYINLRISEHDIFHIEKFKNFLQSSHKISIYKNRGFKPNNNLACISISSYKLADSLAKYGVVPRKSKTAMVIGLEKNIDFWRGMIDGDGWIFQTQNNLPAIGLCGSENIIKQFDKFVKDKHPSCKAQPIKKKNWYFQTSGEPAQNIIRLLYNKSKISLDRKFEIANNFINNPFVSSKINRAKLSYEELIQMHDEFGEWKFVANELKIQENSLYKLLWRKRTGKR